MPDLSDTIELPPIPDAGAEAFFKEKAIGMQEFSAAEEKRLQKIDDYFDGLLRQCMSHLNTQVEAYKAQMTSTEKNVVIKAEESPIKIRRGRPNKDAK
jgi:hypothetical protein|tara:strand:- start:172 stop:465 length:294 start_codon:yes stop_codon:yes gene_type:complete